MAGEGVVPSLFLWVSAILFLYESACLINRDETVEAQLSSQFFIYIVKENSTYK